MAYETKDWDKITENKRRGIRTSAAIRETLNIWMQAGKNPLAKGSESDLISDMHKLYGIAKRFEQEVEIEETMNKPVSEPTQYEEPKLVVTEELVF